MSGFVACLKHSRWTNRVGSLRPFDERAFSFVGHAAPVPGNHGKRNTMSGTGVPDLPFLDFVVFKNKLRFDLFIMLEWMAGICFALALFAGFSREDSRTYQFTSLPSNDTALEDWLVKNARGAVSLSRKANSVTIEQKSTGFPIRHENLPKPPWEDLGYSGQALMASSSGLRLYNASGVVWLIGFGILIALGQIRKRYIASVPTSQIGDSIERHKS